MLRPALRDTELESIESEPAESDSSDVAVPAPTGLATRLRKALGRSRSALQHRFDELFGRPVDDAVFEELEETLLAADTGLPTAERILGPLK